MGKITDEYVKYQRFCTPNIDTSYRCVFRCPQCIRQKISSRSQIQRSFDIEEVNFQKIFDYYSNSITFCGQISDPIYHPDFLKLLKICDGSGKNIRISTVGSGKSDDWWTEAYSYGIGENAWCFGVDGIDSKSELYRIGSDFNDTWARMKQGRDKGHIIVWQYIVFGYNEHEIDRAVEIAKEENFSLLIVNTNRGFDPNNFLLRKSTGFQITKPGSNHLQYNHKREIWAYKTPLHLTRRGNLTAFRQAADLDEKLKQCASPCTHCTPALVITR